jgi:DNA polymerase III alpha subunit
VAWRSAWCKTHFPGEFMAGVLANWGGYYSQRVYVMEARRLGLGVRAPHINFSRANFSYSEDGQGGRQLFMGLDQVRELTRRTIDHIVREQPFHSMDDFLVRVDPRPQEAADLVRVGALEGLGPIPRLLERAQAGRWQARQPSLFDSTEEGAGGRG